MNGLMMIERAMGRGDRVAFVEAAGERTYGMLLESSGEVALDLMGGGGDVLGMRVGLLVLRGSDHVIGQWGVWRAGGVVVPMCVSATELEWEYAIRDSGMRVVVVDGEMAGKVGGVCEREGVRVLVLGGAGGGAGVGGGRVFEGPEVLEDRDAMILYTSGTTSRPKGVVTTHGTIRAQVESLVEAWAWGEGDVIPLFLPMHHIHGIINVVGCAMWVGGRVEGFVRFEMGQVFARVRARAYTLFMAVPTIYVKMIQGLEGMDELEREAVVLGFSGMRLMVSGSAALPATVHGRWRELTGQELLERYGMTEIGMALSNPLLGERRPGAVGIPLPGVGVRLMGEGGVVVEGEEESGEVQVRGRNVFRGYWGREDATRESFDGEWFRTGDMAVRERGYYRIMGRLSVDIIKSGGYKLSALEIESVLLEHPLVEECAVIGLADDTWGEVVTAVLVLVEGTELGLEGLRGWCKERMSAYKVPQRMLVVGALPRNAMGKVTKPAVRALFA